MRHRRIYSVAVDTKWCPCFYIGVAMGLEEGGTAKGSVNKCPADCSLHLLISAPQLLRFVPFIDFSFSKQYNSHSDISV